VAPGASNVSMELEKVAPGASNVSKELKKIAPGASNVSMELQRLLHAPHGWSNSAESLHLCVEPPDNFHQIILKSLDPQSPKKNKI